MNKFSNETIEKIQIPDYTKVRLWGLKFNCGLFNAAGMFKNGESYYVVAAQGAGAYIAGTTTDVPRTGNVKNNIVHPFAPYPNSMSASNWMGLPNLGHAEVALRLSKLDKKKNCPIGASISSSPDQFGKEALEGVINGMNLYTKANVDFLELNESCPNVVGHNNSNVKDGLDIELVQRLEYVQKHFLISRNRNLPLIVKFSNDTSDTQLTSLIDMLVTLGFDGINLGNTSTKYSEHRERIDNKDIDLYDYFTSTYGGGLSGSVLNRCSYNLAKKATEYLKSKNLTKEFHVIRTGGINSESDLEESSSIGVNLNQWYTGYFSAFSKHGHKVYKQLYK